MQSYDVSICSICKMAVEVRSYAYVEAVASHILGCMPSRMDSRHQNSMSAIVKSHLEGEM